MICKEDFAANKGAITFVVTSVLIVGLIFWYLFQSYDVRKSECESHGMKLFGKNRVYLCVNSLGQMYDPNILNKIDKLP